jgi:two-component system, sensor histidine kinase
VAEDDDMSPLTGADAGSLRAASAGQRRTKTGDAAAPANKSVLWGCAPWLFGQGIATAPLDRASVLAGIVGGIGYLALASLSLLLVRADQTTSAIWLPNAFAVAMLLRARLGNEVPFLVMAFAASLSSNVVSQQPDHVALLFSIANMVEIVAVTGLARRSLGRVPDMSRVADLARIVWAGGIVGPLMSAAVAAPVLGADVGTIQRGVIAWFLTDSMTMVLIVPTALLVSDRLCRSVQARPAYRLEATALLIGGTTATFIVFNQTIYPLLFLIPPITLLHAFRLGSLGSALHVGAVAVVAAAMTSAGFGPIAISQGSATTHLHLLQAFIAANFLSGLPVAAILAGRERIVAELEAGKRQVDLLAENITDAILRYDLNGVCTYASPSVKDVMDMAPETLLGLPLGGRLHPEAHDRIMQAMGRLLIGQSDKERVTYRRFHDRADGTPVFLEADAAIAFAPDTGEREGVIVSARDVTERVELELLLTRARRHAESAAQAKSDFLANMSHEIRTPMNGVLGFAELMLQGELSPEQRRYAETIVQSGRSMMMLLNDVLDLSKIESGQFAIDMAPVDLHASLAECTALHRAAAEGKGLALNLSFGDDPDAAGQAWIMTDGLRLRQIMLNLIGNAVKFTDAGHIAVSCHHRPAGIEIMVSDTGIGIMPDRVDEIFLPFTQGEAETMRRFGGTGLGLSISRQLASLLGGRITVKSTIGQGSCFTLVLPAARVAPPLADPEPDRLADPVDLPADARILLVEDHDINRLLMTEMLARCGQDVEVAHDGNEAIAMVIDSMVRARPFDLVLMDVQMPNCDGYAATRAIRAEGIGPEQLPIIALTANAFPEDVTAAREAGMQAHLAKPIALPQLARALQRWLPTRIVEAAPGRRRPARRSAMAHSPALIARWHQRRHEALSAIEQALAQGWLDDEDLPVGDERGCALAALVHKLAGTAAMFGEPDLGAAATALDRALTGSDAASSRVAIARRVLALGAALPAETETPPATRQARG